MVITLSKKALKYLDDKIVQVEIDDNLLKKYTDIKAVTNAKGILKKYNTDGLAYQKKVRIEWDRKIELK